MGIFFRIFIFLLVIFFVLSWFKRLGMKRMQREQMHDQRKSVSSASGQQQTMARCRYCSVFMPQDMMVRGRDGLYCSDKHRELDQKTS